MSLSGPRRYQPAHLATIRLVQGRLAEAINIADKALEMDPESDELREFLERIIEDAPK